MVLDFGWFSYVLIFITAMVMISMLIETCGVSFVIPVSQCDLNLTPTKKGRLTAISFFGIVCSSHLWGPLANTKRRRRITQPTSLCQNMYALVALRFLNGFL